MVDLWSRMQHLILGIVDSDELNGILEKLRGKFILQRSAVQVVTLYRLHWNILDFYKGYSLSRKRNIFI